MSEKPKYTKICLATDLSQYAHYVGQKALSLPFAHENFVVFHVVEAPVVYTHAFAEFNQLLINLKKQAENSMHGYLTSLGLPLESGIIEMGTSKNTIVDFIKKNEIDLLILGSHGVGGFSHLIGTTASFVVTNAPCDVWMINVEKASKKALSPSEFANPAQAYPTELIKKITPKLPDEAPDRFGITQHPVFSGSNQGVKQDISRGPHLTNRPPGAPTTGQARDKKDDENK